MDTQLSPVRHSSPLAAGQRFFLEVIRVIAGRRWILKLEHRIKILTCMEDNSRKAAETLKDTQEEVEIRQMLVEEATQTVSRTSEIEKLLPKARDELAKRLALMNNLDRDFLYEYLNIAVSSPTLGLSGPAKVPSWPFPLQQPPSESFVQAKDRVLNLLEQAKQVFEFRQLRSDEIVRLRSEEEDLQPARGLQRARLRIWDTMANSVPVVLTHLRQIEVSVADIAKQRIRDLEKLEEWLSEAVVDLVLEWKRNKKMIGVVEGREGQGVAF